MKSQTLTINYEDITPFSPARGVIQCRVIRASNPFMLIQKVEKFITRDIYVKSYNLVNNKWEAGSNHPINSEAYLWELLEELNA